MIRKRKRGLSDSGRNRRQREEQLELDLTRPNETVVRPIVDLHGTSRAPAASETQAKRLRNGVLVQQMLK